MRHPSEHDLMQSRWLLYSPAERQEESRIHFVCRWSKRMYLYESNARVLNSRYCRRRRRRRRHHHHHRTRPGVRSAEPLSELAGSPRASRLRPSETRQSVFSNVRRACAGWLDIPGEK
jgi:hypothetical protein